MPKAGWMITWLGRFYVLYGISRYGFRFDFSSFGYFVTNWLLRFNIKYCLSTQTPGPGAYKLPSPELYKSRKTPGVTIVGRRTMSGSNASGPGPGTYRPESVSTFHPVLRTASFRIRCPCSLQICRPIANNAVWKWNKILRISQSWCC